MANTTRNTRDGHEENVMRRMWINNTEVDGREGVVGVIVLQGVRVITRYHPLPPMDAEMANMMPMMQAFYAQMFQRLQLLVGTLVQDGETGNKVQQAPRAPSYLDMMNQMTNLKTGQFNGGCKPIEAEEWKSCLERNFLSLHCQDEHRKDLAVFFSLRVMHTSGGRGFFVETRRRCMIETHLRKSSQGNIFQLRPVSCWRLCFLTFARGKIHMGL